MEKCFLSRDYTGMMRGVAILLVFMGHLGCNYSKPLVALGGIGVFIFLFLSGYGLRESWLKNGLEHFWKKKMLRVLLPYLIWILLYHLVMRISPLAREKIFLIPRYWFVEYILVWYVVFWFVYKFFPKFDILIMLCVSIIMFFLYDKAASEQSLSFLTGIMFSKYKDYLVKIKSVTYWKSGVCLLLWGGGIFNSSVINIASNFWRK